MKAFIEGDEIKLENLDVVHVNHNIPMSKEEIHGDVYLPFVVFESFSNHPIIHGVMSATTQEALDYVNDFLLNKVDYEQTDFTLSVEQLKF